LKTDDVKQGKTIQNLTMEVKGLKRDDVKLNERVKKLENDDVQQEQNIIDLQTDDTRQGKTIQNLTEDLNELKKDTEKTISTLKRKLKKLQSDDDDLNERVDELAKRKCQIGQYSNQGRKKVGYGKDFEVDVTFDKSFSDKPEVLLSFGGVVFKDIGFDGWWVYAESVSKTGFKMKVEGYAKYIEIFRINYIACIL